MTATRTPEEYEAIARDVCLIRSTDQLVESFRLTDALLHESGGEDRACVAISRGWILDEIETRRSLHLIGICDGCYSELARCDCPREEVV